MGFNAKKPKNVPIQIWKIGSEGRSKRLKDTQPKPMFLS